MERILNDDEKIRKAEEIYYRRNNQNISMRNRQEEKKVSTVRDRILLQLLVMIDIAIIVFCVQNKDFIFTKEFLEVVNDYNDKASSKVVEFFSGIWNDNKEVINNENVENIVDNQANEENIDSKSQENQENNNQNQSVEDVKLEVDSSSLSEMELDIQNLKTSYSFIKPIEGIISSGFGARESEYQNVTGYHKGIDIAANSGTPIKASMEGIVEEISSQGDYGNHLKIRNNNVVTLYAHCSKVYVQEGQFVSQNQEIASVGSTGNSTGPHLHFEIRVDDRLVDPAQIITF